MNMWGVLACLFACLFHLSIAFSSFTFVDRYLREAQLRIVQVQDWYECIKQCQEEPLCISYNFDNKSECQINGHGVEERCHAEEELTNRAGWIFHQIREVKQKTGRSKTQGSCPCNCGASKQCRVEPGYGDVPDTAATSCQDILDRRGLVPNGAYYLQRINKPVYCHMTSIPGCGDEGGWTLVMKINGSKDDLCYANMPIIVLSFNQLIKIVDHDTDHAPDLYEFDNKSTFKYDSKYWKDPQIQEYHPENGANLDKKETKLLTFKNLAFQKICMGMKTFDNSSIRWIMKKRSRGDTLISIFMDPSRDETFGFDKAKWLSLLPGSAMDAGLMKDGFNVQPKNKDGARVRIGAIAYPGPSDSGNPISYIGFGAGGDASAMHMGLSCGNVNGTSYIPAFGYILVKEMSSNP